jgi:large subunit ribosomal protein L24
MKIKRGDTVLIIAGDDRLKKGKVIKVLAKEGKILVEGVNIQKKHRRPQKEGQKGQIIEKPGPIDVSNVKLICPKCKKATKIGYPQELKTKQKSKVRICKKCGQSI